jgi:hypothetical protein
MVTTLGVLGVVIVLSMTFPNIARHNSRGLQFVDRIESKGRQRL